MSYTSTPPVGLHDLFWGELYLYLYMCVCVCVCVCDGQTHEFMHMSAENAKCWICIHIPYIFSLCGS